MPATTQFELRLAGRMSRLGTETAFEVNNRARQLEKQGKEIIHLEIGEPDFDTPANVIEAGVDALHKGWTHYGPAAGLPDLRQIIADYISRTRKVPVSSEEVVVVPGGKPIIFFTILALIDAGDEVIYPNPGFPIYESMINYSLGKAIPIPLREDRDFSVDVQELASLITDRTKLIILNSPHNPTGGVLTKKDILQIAEAIGDRNILILSDEIYSRLIYEGDHSSVDKMSAEFKRRRDVFVAGLNKIKGFSCRVPKGAFYAFPNITKTGWSSKKLADALLEQAGVACLSGTAFGEYGEGYLRFSVANSLENLSKALGRIVDWVGKNLR